jgi:tetratricopeptide (TPR) repeat protein
MLRPIDRSAMQVDLSQLSAIMFGRFQIDGGNMPDGPGDFVEVYRSRGLPEAYAIRTLLEGLGVPVHIDNEMLQGALGDLPVGWVTAPRILVHPHQESIARRILDEFLQRSEPNEAEADRRPRCLACGMPMGGADTCPICGWSYKITEAGESADSEIDPAVEDESKHSSNDNDVIATSQTAPSTITDDGHTSPSMRRQLLTAIVITLFAVTLVGYWNHRNNLSKASECYGRGMAWYNQKDYDKAITEFDEAISYDPEYILALYGRGGAWMAKKEYDKAICDYNAIIHIDAKEFSALCYRGNAWLDKKEFDRAISDYDEVMRHVSGRADPFAGRGAAWLGKKELDKALRDYDDAIRLDPKYAWAYCGRGWVFYHKKAYDDAVNDFDKAIRLDPTNPDAFIARGSFWSQRKVYDKAIANFDEAYRLDPKNIDALNDRGWVWQQKKVHDKAIADYNEVIRLDPKNVNAISNKAYSLAVSAEDRIRNIGEARELMKTVLELRNQSPYNEENLSVIAAALGHFDDAIKHQKKALEDKDYAEENGDDARERLKAYENGRAWRE